MNQEKNHPIMKFCPHFIEAYDKKPGYPQQASLVPPVLRNAHRLAFASNAAKSRCVCNDRDEGQRIFPMLCLPGGLSVVDPFRQSRQPVPIGDDGGRC